MMTAKLDHDLHMHTYLSACCEDKEGHRPAAILATARRMGLRLLGFADHLWVNPALDPSGWYRPQDASQTARLRADLAGLDTSGLRVLVGCEAETIAPGRFGITPEYARSLDFVLLACSHFHMKGFVEQPASDAPRDVARNLVRFFSSAVTSGLATSIPHPFLPCGFMERFDEIIEAIPDSEFLDAFALAAAHGVGIEITTAFLPAPPRRGFSLETPVRMLSLARQAGCRFTFGSDAHRPEAQARLPELQCLLDAVGVTEQDVLPTPTSAKDPQP